MYIHTRSGMCAGDSPPRALWSSVQSVVTEYWWPLGGACARSLHKLHCDKLLAVVPGSSSGEVSDSAHQIVDGEVLDLHSNLITWGFVPHLKYNCINPYNLGVFEVSKRVLNQF